MQTTYHKLTPKQKEAQHKLGGTATNILLYGGSRSGKTYLAIRTMVNRAICADGSRHAVLGFRQNRIKQAIILDTFPKVMRECFPDAGGHLDKVEHYYLFPNGSEIWFGGLDDAERSEKVLGKEYATVLLNEASQISNEARENVTTRIAQKVLITKGEPEQIGKPLRTRMYCDCNPPKKTHWTYKLFIKKVDPADNKPLKNPEDYDSIRMNPEDNKDNLDSGYMSKLDNLSAAKRRRFRDGLFGDADPNQLFDEDTIEKYRVLDADELPDMVRIVVGVDPSGADDKNNEDNDAIGIVIGGLGTDGNAYVLEDRTVKSGPAVWGKTVCNAYDDHDADIVVGEENFGGAMVKFVIRTANPRIPYKKVTATRGKVVRAEPVSALHEQGKIRICGYMRELEEEVCGMTTHGYTGDKSPNRADAFVWVMYALFPHLTKPKEEKQTDYEPFTPIDAGCGY